MAMVALDGHFLAAEGLSTDIISGVALLAAPLDFLPLDDPATIAAHNAKLFDDPMTGVLGELGFGTPEDQL